jgi:ATP-binding cassette subfamily C protein
VPNFVSANETLRTTRGAFAAVGLFSAAINVLTLSGSLFMLQVYDRVLPSRSVPTLVALTALVGALFACQALFEALRLRLLGRIGRVLDDKLSASAYVTVARSPLRTAHQGTALQPLHDLDQVRSFLSGLGPTALFDLPWIPFYLGLCFLFHFWIGITATIGALLLVGVTVATEVLSRSPAQKLSSMATQRLARAEATRRGAEVIHAMGMSSRLAALWDEKNTEYMDVHQTAADAVSSLGSLSRVLRLALQSGVLAVGAYLVIVQQASPGIIIASSILSARALAPVDVAIANWRGFLGARQSWSRLRQLVTLPAVSIETQLPRPRDYVELVNLSLCPPSSTAPVVQNVSLRLTAGQGLGIIGPSGSGKSSLARGIVGIWPAARGKVRIDGATLDQWLPDDLGQHIGYLPQDVQLFDGTIAENISRFQASIDADAVISAAKAAGVHDLILRLPFGYDTPIGDSGIILSAGQKQRVGLARALFGDPFLVVLDEPNSNLDGDGEDALARAILNVRERKGIVILIAHRRSILANVDQILVLIEGQMQSFGPKDKVLQTPIGRRA